MYCSQNRALLDTLRIQQSNRNTGHIILYSTLLLGHTQHPDYMRMSSWPFVSKQLRKSYRQDNVFLRLPGISEGAFQLRMWNIWFYKLLLLFKIRSKTDAEIRDPDCVYVYVLEEYTGKRRKGDILQIYIWSLSLGCILRIYLIFIWFLFLFFSISAWVNDCQSTIVYERRDWPANSYKYCMSFRYPPYSVVFFLFQWGRPAQYPLTCEENQPTFQGGQRQVP